MEKQLKLVKTSPKRTHIAIMKKEWGLTQKILVGEKTIESRWYMQKSPPWNGINKNDILYFKDSGGPISIKSEVSKVLQFENLTPQKVQSILDKYGKKDGLGIVDIKRFYEMFKNKKYCILVFLKDVEKVPPFNINKAGFGNQTAWLIVEDLSKIKRPAKHRQMHLS